LGRVRFGSVVFKDKEYRHDIVICDGRVTRRRKELSAHMRSKYGHTPLTAEELKQYIDECGEPEVVLVGTGVYGALPLDDDAEKFLDELSRRGVEVVKSVTDDEFVNRVENEKRRYLAVIHVTC